MTVEKILIKASSKDKWLDKFDIFEGRKYQVLSYGSNGKENSNRIIVKVTKIYDHHFTYVGLCKNSLNLTGSINKIDILTKNYRLRPIIKRKGVIGNEYKI